MKRVIGLPGDRLSVVDGAVHLNGEQVHLRPVGDGVEIEELNGREWRVRRRKEGSAGPDFGEFVVPNDTCFLLGDARGNSRDCRSFGAVPLGDVTGTVRWRFWGDGIGAVE